MSTAWDEYVALLEESACLTEREGRAVAEADAACGAEVRRLQNDLVRAEREHKTLRDRNTRLQVSVRDLVRTLGVSVASSSGPPALRAEQLSSAMNAAEYDLERVRASLTYLQAQREQPAVLPEPELAPARAVVPVERMVVAPDDDRSSSLPVTVGIGGIVVLLVIVVVVLL